MREEGKNTFFCTAVQEKYALMKGDCWESFKKQRFSFRWVMMHLEVDSFLLPFSLPCLGPR